MKIKRMMILVAGLSAGGQERHMSNMANEFSEMGIEVHICCFFKTKIFWELHPNITYSFPDIERENTNRLVYAFKIIPYIRKNIKANTPDVIVSFGEWFNPYSIFATRFLKIPTYLMDLMGPAIEYGKLVSNLRKIAYPKAQGVIVQTTTAKKIVEEKLGIANVHVVPNPLNPKNISAKAKKNMVISIGRLSKEKGHAVLLNAFAKIQNKEWTLEFIGDGDQRDKLEAQCDELGITNRVSFHGYQTEFDNILAEASIFVLPSFYEGFPNALIESMSVPLACISSNCVAGPADIIEDGKNGYLFETGNAQDLAQKLDILMADENLRNSFAEQAFKIRKRLEKRTISKRYLQIFSNY